MNCLCNRDNLPLSFSLSLCLWAGCSYGDRQSLLQAHLIFCLGRLFTVEIHRMLAPSHLLWRQQILAAEQLQVPAGIRLDTAVVVGQEFTYKQISQFEPCVTILTNCECTEMCLLNSEDAPEAQIYRVQSPGGSQFLHPSPHCPCQPLLNPHSPTQLVQWPTGKVDVCSTQFCGLPPGELEESQFPSDLRCCCSQIFPSYW